MLPSGVISALVQVAVALIASGVAVKLLTLRQDRRKIAGEASTSEANAASTLSGAALQMVEAAQKAARESEARTVSANASSDDARKQNQQLWEELNKAKWENHWKDAQIQVMQEALKRANIILQPPPRPVNGFPDFPPPEMPQFPPPAS